MPLGIFRFVISSPYLVFKYLISYFKDCNFLIILSSLDFETASIFNLNNDSVFDGLKLNHHPPAGGLNSIVKPSRWEIFVAEALKYRSIFLIFKFPFLIFIFFYHERQ